MQRQDFVHALVWRPGGEEQAASVWEGFQCFFSWGVGVGFVGLRGVSFLGGGGWAVFFWFERFGGFFPFCEDVLVGGGGF